MGLGPRRAGKRRESSGEPKALPENPPLGSRNRRRENITGPALRLARGPLRQGGSPHTSPGQSTRRHAQTASDRTVVPGQRTWRHTPREASTPVRREEPRGRRVSSVLWNLSKVSTMSVCRLYEQK